MAVRRPVVFVGGKRGLLPAGDMLPSTMLAGSVTDTPVIGDAGRMIDRSASFTMPGANVFLAGDSFVVTNVSAAAITLTAPAGMTMRLVTGASKASISLAAYGTAAVLYRSTAECVVGGGVS